MTPFEDHLATGTSNVCRAWILKRTDGEVFGFTDHDMSLEVDGTICHASSGLTAGALQSATGLSVDNVEAKGALSHDAISTDDLRAGRWDEAEVRAYLVNWAEPSQHEILFRGTLGEISWGDGAFSAELRGLAETLNRVRGRVYQSRCDAVLGDGRCRLDLQSTLYRIELPIMAIEENRVLILPQLPLYEAQWFERGRVQVLDGAARGLVEQVKTDRTLEDQRRVELWASLRAEAKVGDTILLEAGCDRRMETCRYKFNNLLNFRGFPHIPGEDWLMAYPTSTSVNDGGKL
ncbi:MAG: DUF2163 domain-containing protein [Jannaschia sp.]